MDVDYYSLLTKAVAGKDAPARDRIYKDAFSLITRAHLVRETAASHVAALEDAVRRIEDDIAAEEANAAAISATLSTGTNWKPFVIGKSVDCVPPVTHILPWESTAIAFPDSRPIFWKSQLRNTILDSRVDINDSDRLRFPGPALRV